MVNDVGHIFTNVNGKKITNTKKTSPSEKYKLTIRKEKFSFVVNKSYVKYFLKM